MGYRKRLSFTENGIYVALDLSELKHRKNTYENTLAQQENERAAIERFVIISRYRISSIPHSLFRMRNYFSRDQLLKMIRIDQKVVIVFSL